MITGLDHIVVLTGDISAASAAYETLFARAPAWRRRWACAFSILAVRRYAI